ncbi:hypothetical protein FIBSPDRAFT_60590 [Athelia psychrophila]|uniref:Uncharacterized protein n=1 Tax=Athelia psychrophila TaxID=1759441 RepID=A0A166F5I8_9AGAM|nr:hypothetical protein FIBSPDRAFT_60590 [Fibularhizoctonia sp. CBS 109695]
MINSALCLMLKVHVTSPGHVGTMPRWLQFAHHQPLSICFDTGYARDITISRWTSSWSTRAPDTCFQVELDWRVSPHLPLLGNVLTPSHAPLLQQVQYILN